MKKYAAIFMMILGLLAGQAQAGAEPPPNDNLAGAIPLVINGGTAAMITSNFNATKQQNEPEHAENVGGKSVWFSFTPTETKTFRINTVDNTVDTLLAVYTGTNMSDLQLVGYNNDCNNNCGNASTMDLMLTAGTTYYIAVDGYNDGNSVGQGSFKIVLLEFNPPYADNFGSAQNLGTAHGGSIAGTNYGATREPNEPEHNGSVYPGAKTVWYKWTPGSSFGASFQLTEDFNSQITVYRSSVNSPTFAQLTRIGGTLDILGDYTSRYHVKFFAESGKTYFIAVSGHNSSANLPDAGNFQLKFSPFKMSYSMNVQGYRSRAAIAVYRPSEGNWYTITSVGNYYSNAVKWGINGDTPMAADFDGDAISERTIVRNENGQKVWYIKTLPEPTVMHWGLASDKAVVGDFDGDSRADLAAIRLSAQGFVWYVRQSLSGSMRTFTFGTTGDRPVLGDFDGDRLTEVAVIRNTQNGLVWYMLNSGSNNYSGFSAQQFGTSTDIPAVEDFDGDGKTDIAVFRPSTGVWYILQSGNGQVRIESFGLSGDKPQPADYDGDGKANLAVYRPSDGTWYIAKPTGVPAQNFYSIPWGVSTDIPVTSLATLSQ